MCGTLMISDRVDLMLFAYAQFVSESLKEAIYIPVAQTFAPLNSGWAKIIRKSNGQKSKIEKPRVLYFRVKMRVQPSPSTKCKSKGP